MPLCSPQPLAQCQGQNVWLEPPMVPRPCPLEQGAVAGRLHSGECHREACPASQAGPCPSEHDFGQTQSKSLPWSPARAKHGLQGRLQGPINSQAYVRRGKWQKSQEAECELGMQLPSSTRVSLYCVHPTSKVNKNLGLKGLTDFFSPFRFGVRFQ